MSFEILNYKQVFFPAIDENGKTYIAIRSFNRNREPYFLLVNPDTLETSISSAYNLVYRSSGGYFTEETLSRTAYYKALAAYKSPAEKMENYGIKHGPEGEEAVFITIDMCQSQKISQWDLFSDLERIGEEAKKLVPIALCISRLWILGHERELKYLARLNPTFVGHSYSHEHIADVPFEQNFLLYPRQDVLHEIFGLEQMLLERDLMPSVFFRFPGLIANDQLIKIVNECGLLVLGADAWLAKEQLPTPGSIILVQGNSNEAQGIPPLLEILHSGKFKFKHINHVLPHTAVFQPTDIEP